MGLFELVAAPILKIIDKVVPDPVAKAAAQLEVLKLKQDGDFREMESTLKRDLGQLEVNKVEAASSSTFVSAWRPATGWICNLGLLYQFVAQPLLSWFASAKGFPAPPRLDTDTLIMVLGGMLGLSGMRTTEKLNGVAAK